MATPTTHRSARRPTALLPTVLALLAALATGIALFAPPVSAQTEDDGVQPARVAGTDRNDTAAQISAATFEQADVVHLVTGEDFPDALAASYAAGAVDGPILLTGRDALPQTTIDELARLDAQAVVIIGGEGAVSADVAEQISDAGYDVDRIEGTTRLQTAASVALVYGRDEGVVGTVDGDRTAVMASETGFADALAIGPLANALNLPLLLTPPDAARDTGVNNAVFQLELDRIIIAGGEGAVSEDVAEFYRERDIVVERLAGRDRTETAAVIADAAIDRFAFSAELALLARGDDFPDALAASAHAGTLTAPLLLTANPTVLSPSTEGWFTDRCPDVEAVRAIGGTGAVSEQALSEAVSAAEQCREDGPGFTFCSNAEADYTVSHPDDWATNIESIDDVPACSLFDPDADAIRAEGSTVPADIAVYLRASDIDFAEASTANMDEELLDRRETTVDGRDAVRLEVRFTGEGAFDEGTLGTRWVIDRGDEILIGVSYDIGEPAYAEKQEVLDAMVDSLAFDLG